MNRRIIQQVIRFARKLRLHGIPDTRFTLPMRRDIREDAAVIVVGNRIVVVDYKGEARQCLRPFDDLYDRYALHAASQRWHANLMAAAANSRKRGWLDVARIDIEAATIERIAGALL